MRLDQVTIVLALLLCFTAAVLAVPNNKKPVQDSSGNPISSFFSSVLGYIQNGLSTLFGAESRDASRSKRVSYRGYQLMRATPRTSDQLTEMRGVEEEFDGVKFWRAPRTRNASADLQVPPDQVESVKGFFRDRQIDFEILSQDIQKMIAHQNPKMTKERRDELRGTTGHTMTWRRYHRFVDIMTYLDHLAAKYADTVTVEKIGKSYGGLPLRVVKISAPINAKQQNTSAKTAVWIDGGTHAREWISPAVATYIIKQLAENSKVNKQLLDNFDWYILPVLNPDGYEYSHTTDRLWRKTRSTTSDDDDDLSRGSRIARVFFGSCDGVDLNRNWDYHWGERGASDDPCDEIYAGPRAFSEPETRAVADFILPKRNEFKLFLTLHSYGQMWLMPWGYTREKLADHTDLMKLGQAAIDALVKVQGTQYSLGPTTSLLYHSSGGSDDWAKGVAGIKYAYTVELRDTGDHGFLLPASQIIPTGKETFAAIKAMARTLAPPRIKVKPQQQSKPPVPKAPKPSSTPSTTTPATSTTPQRGRGRISNTTMLNG